MPENKIEFVLQEKRFDGWLDLMTAGVPNNLGKYANMRKENGCKLKQRVIKRITTVEEEVYVTI